MAVSASRGSPTFTLATPAVSSSSNATRRPSETRMRVPAMQAWPLFMKPASSTAGMTAGRSASSRIRVGDLPPSSRVTRFRVSALARTIALPTTVEPVNEILATSGCDVSSAPTTSPRPLTMLNTPAGRPAACRRSTTISVCSALISLGLITAVQPAANA